MENKKSLWSTIMGGLSSVFPVLFSVCKGGACAGVCVTPVASLFGISAATIAASPLTSILEPIFIALSAISFTVSYYSLYRIPRLTVAPAGSCATPNACDCGPAKSASNFNSAKFIFWLSLILSVGFLSYFEYNKYNSLSTSGSDPAGCAAGQSTNSSAAGGELCCGDDESCGTSDTLTQSCSQSAETCCAVNSELISTSIITCPGCGFKKSEIMPTEICQLKYTCTKCRTELFPKDGDCCVYCSYGDQKCPSQQSD